LTFRHWIIIFQTGSFLVFTQYSPYCALSSASSARTPLPVRAVLFVPIDTNQVLFQFQARHQQPTQTNKQNQQQSNPIIHYLGIRFDCPLSLDIRFDCPLSLSFFLLCSLDPGVAAVVFFVLISVALKTTCPDSGGIQRPAFKEFISTSWIGPSRG
jgi:hypothetical protein